MADLAGRLLVVWTILVSANLPAAEVFYDYAEVMEVQPVVEPTSAATIASPCRPAGLAEPDWGSRPQTGDGIRSLTAALRFEIESRAGAGVCDPAHGDPVTVNRYRVTYRYGGVDYVRVMERDPGGRVQVRVRVEPDS